MISIRFVRLCCIAMSFGRSIVNFNAETHLKNIIIPYWNSMKDDEHGGFYGFRTYDLEILKKADKGVVLHRRILWF